MIVEATMATAAAELDVFPGDAQGWTLAPQGETYTPGDLYKYIDGASELYISYGFRSLSTRSYERTGWPEITVDVFDMGLPGNAFGIFAHSQEDPGREIGMDSEYLDGLLRFWQGRHYVSILCSPETPESRTAVMALGRRIAQRLPQGNGRPDALSLLAQDGLIPASIRYFRHPAWQNAYVFLSADNILDIGPDSEAVLAKYDQEGQRPVALLVRYRDAAAAGRAFAALSGIFRLPAGGGAVQLADKKYFSAARENRVVAAVWHAGGPAPAQALLAAVRAAISAHINSPPQGGER